MIEIKIEKEAITIIAEDRGKLEMHKHQIHEFSVAINMLAELVIMGDFDCLDYTLK